MKTITLTDEAYERLKSWKDRDLDSFSKVVLAKIPRKGTLGDLAKEMGALPPLTEVQAKTMEDATRWANDWRNQGEAWKP